MLHLRFVSLAALPVVALFACTQVDQPLGDTAAGQGGAGGSSAGVGGSTGGTGGTDETGGTGQSGGSAGASATGGAAGRGSSSGGRAGSGGSGNEPGESGAPSTGGTAGGPGTECYSPSAPAGALNGAEGCACGAVDQDQCIRVQEGGGPHLLSFHCVDGRWASVEDGVCDVPRGCLVDNRLYPENAGIPSPYDDCNSCGCSLDGNLACTEIGCAGTVCPEGTDIGSACFSCGPAGGCSIVEFGCIPTCDDARDCDYGTCTNGLCDLACI